MAMPDVPRDPSFYFPSQHAIVRKKERDIKWEWVSETLESGHVNPSMKENCRVFMKRIEPEEDDMESQHLKVIASIECGEIVTVAWNR